MSLFDEIPIVAQPEDLKKSLYKHQLASVWMMEEREKKGCDIKLADRRSQSVSMTFGINADPTGYGKTLSMVALVLRDKMEWDMKTEYVVNQSMSQIHDEFYGGVSNIEILSSYVRVNATIVIVSSSIIHQWKAEFSHTPLKVAVLVNRKSIVKLDLANTDVILIVPSMYSDFHARYRNFAWKRVIIDEPHMLKLSYGTNIVAGMTWLVTATPRIIYKRGNRTVHISESLLAMATVKNDPQVVLQSFTMPPINHHYHKCVNPVYRAVVGLVSSSVAEMIDAGDIQGAVSALGGETTDNLTELVRNRQMKKIEGIKTRIEHYTQMSDALNIAKWLKKHEEALKQMDALIQRCEDVLTNDCCICQESPKSPVIESNCHNAFCGACLFEWLKTKDTCPMCRNRIDKKSLTYIKQTDDDVKGKPKTCQQIPHLPLTKANIIIKLIEDTPSGKFIIFSNHDSSFTPIRHCLESNNISYVEIKGASSTRCRDIDSFKTGPVRVMFINSIHNSSGINLQEATDIIIYHAMSQCIETQILGRALRIGRVEPLNVHHLQS